jgi:hypothetical protein
LTGQEVATDDHQIIPSRFHACEHKLKRELLLLTVVLTCVELDVLVVDPKDQNEVAPNKKSTITTMKVLWFWAPALFFVAPCMYHMHPHVTEADKIHRIRRTAAGAVPSKNAAVKIHAY